MFLIMSLKATSKNYASIFGYKNCHFFKLCLFECFVRSLSRLNQYTPWKRRILPTLQLFLRIRICTDRCFSKIQHVLRRLTMRIRIQAPVTRIIPIPLQRQPSAHVSETFAFVKTCQFAFKNMSLFGNSMRILLLSVSFAYVMCQLLV